MTNKNLIDDLQSKDYHTRWFAAEVLGTKRDLTNSQIKDIIRISKKSDVGEVLVWGLGMMKVPGVEKLIGSFLEHPINYFRWRAAEALRDIGTKKAIEVLSQHFDKSKKSETRWKCAWALGEIGSPDSFEILWRHLEDKDRYTRWKSVWAISMLKGKTELIIRKKILLKINNYLAWRSMWVLGRIGTTDTINFLESVRSRNLYPSKYVNYQLELSLNKLKTKYNEK